MKQELRPSIVFSTMPVFDMLRNQLHMANYRIIQFIDAKVSLDRINDFLHHVRVPPRSPRLLLNFLCRRNF
jgi:hypothetical protein